MSVISAAERAQLDAAAVLIAAVYERLPSDVTTARAADEAIGGIRTLIEAAERAA
jgi:hypothetical protein